MLVELTFNDLAIVALVDDFAYTVTVLVRFECVLDVSHVQSGITFPYDQALNPEIRGRLLNLRLCYLCFLNTKRTEHSFIVVIVSAFWALLLFELRWCW